MSQPNLEFITYFCYSVNQLFIEDKDIKIDNLTTILGMSRRSLNRKIFENTGLTPIGFINLIRFYIAYIKIRDGERIENVLFAIKIDSLSYFYKKFKQHFGINPSQLNVLHKPYIQFNILCSNYLCCNIESYHYFSKKLNQGTAHLLSHEDFKDITVHPISPTRIYDALYNYLVLDFKKNVSFHARQIPE